MNTRNSEPRARWRKSSHSGGNGECVEVASASDGHVRIRDSKRPEGGHLSLTPEAFGAVVRRIRTGRLDV